MVLFTKILGSHPQGALREEKRGLGFQEGMKVSGGGRVEALTSHHPFQWRHPEGTPQMYWSCLYELLTFSWFLLRKKSCWLICSLAHSTASVRAYENRHGVSMHLVSVYLIQRSLLQIGKDDFLMQCPNTTVSNVLMYFEGSLGDQSSEGLTARLIHRMTQRQSITHLPSITDQFSTLLIPTTSSELGSPVPPVICCQKFTSALSCF